jgi:hypothetical protein
MIGIGSDGVGHSNVGNTSLPRRRAFWCQIEQGPHTRTEISHRDQEKSSSISSVPPSRLGWAVTVLTSETRPDLICKYVPSLEPVMNRVHLGPLGVMGLLVWFFCDMLLNWSARMRQWLRNAHRRASAQMAIAAVLVAVRLLEQCPEKRRDCRCYVERD